MKRTLAEISQAFLKLGALSYGGPAVMGIMQADIQEKRQWLSKERFLEGLSLVNMMPGPGATQLAIFIGYDQAGWRGGVTAGLSFMLPAFLILSTLTWAYSTFGSVGFVRDAFYGIGPVVLGIFTVAVWRLGKMALSSRTQIAIAVASALVVAYAPVGIATVLILAGCAGVALYQSRRNGLIAAAAVLLVALAVHSVDADLKAAVMPQPHAPDWLDLGVFFLKVGALTFGGGITILAFVQEQVVNQLHWLTAQEFLDGLAIGQLTPGPIIMLAAYIGYKTAGLAGGVICAVAIFLPSFVLMLSILPVLSRVRNIGWIKAAMKAIGAAAVGALAVALLRLLPHAAPDAFTSVLFALAVAVMLLRWTGPLTLLLGGAAAGVARNALGR